MKHWTIRGGETACATVLLTTLTITMAASAAPVSTAENGWTIVADPDAQTVRIDHAGLGPVLRNVRLCVRDSKGIQALAHWTATESGGLLVINAQHPRMAWQFTAGADALIISSTSFEAAIMAEAPAPPTR